MTPEQKTREEIDVTLGALGWAVQDYAQYNPAGSLRQFVLQKAISGELLALGGWTAFVQPVMARWGKVE